MDINFLIVAWLVGAGTGLYYSVRGTREAWGDLIAVTDADAAARVVAGSALKSQGVRAVIQTVWLIIGLIALFANGGVFVLWGLIFTNFALAYISREAYLSKRRVLDMILHKNQKEI